MEESKWKDRELNMMEKKVVMETKKAEVWLTILQIQQKEQLLLTQKRLLDAGVSPDEVNSVLPMNNGMKC